MKKMLAGNRCTESGNVFLFIFMGVALFGILMFTFSRSGSQQSTGISNKQAEILATDMISYGQQLERAVSRLKRFGCLDLDISFYSPLWTGGEDYDNSNTPVAGADFDCHVFHPDGGSVNWKTFEPGEPKIMRIRHPGLDDGGSDEAEAAVHIPLPGSNTCEYINGKLGIPFPPPADDDIYGTAYWDGDSSSTPLAECTTMGTTVPCDNIRAGCFLDHGTTNYYYVHILLVR